MLRGPFGGKLQDPGFDDRLYERDLYGGSLVAKFEPSGYFRLERDDRWWFVTPEGHPFLSFGLNHADPDELLWPHNKRYWMAEFGVDPDQDEGAYLRAFEAKVERDMIAFGLNTLGCHTPIAPFRSLKVPYVHTVRFVDICHWMTPTAGDFPDVYSPAFEAHCDRLAAREAAPLRGDPFLLGYTMTDCPILTRLDAAPRTRVTYGRDRGGTPTWPDVLRNLDGGSPGKRAYVELMRETYSGDISGLNAVYGTRFDSFEDLQTTVDWAVGIDGANAPQVRDQDAFLAQIVERYYQVTTGALRRHDPNHLVLGDKLNGNTGVPDDLVTIAARYVDALFYQFYAYYQDQEPLLDRWSQMTGKPLLNGDSSYAVPNERMRDPNGPHSPTQEERARQFTEFGRRAFARPDFVGWHWCGWMDRWQGYHREARHSGLQDPFGNLYQPMQQAMADFAARMYAIATGVD